MRPLEYKGLGQHGRLGNMLWQIAGTVGVARSLGRDPQVRPDWPYRPFFSLPEDWYGDQPSESVTKHVVGSRWRVRYMQDPILWADVADEILAAFAPSVRAQAVLDGLPEPEPDDVAVHVRRTDYLTMPDHLPVLSVGYYDRAVFDLCDPPADGPVHMFTDDPEWCEANLYGWPVVSQPYSSPTGITERSGEPTDWLDLFRMARYRRLVIANSSYSWFSAFLAGPEAHVVAPEPWFGPRIDVPSPALDSWSKVAIGGR